MSPSGNSPFSTKTPKRVRRPANFAEALLEIGGQTVRSARDLATGVTSDAVRSVVGGGMPSGVSGELSPSQPLDLDAKLKEQEVKFREEQAKRERHQEVIRQAVYDRQEEETKLQIKALQEELKKLAQEIGTLNADVARAVEEEIVHPGTYHVSFFSQLRQFLVQLRQRVSESRNWLALSGQRRKSRNYYWGQVQKSGTKFMLSQERYMSTQAG